MKTTAKLMYLAATLAVMTNTAYGQSWSLTGNSGTTTSHFIGTTDNVDLKIRTNNTVRATFASGGQVGIGVTPDANYKFYSSYTKPTLFNQSEVYAATKGRQIEGSINFTTHSNGYLGAFYSSGSILIGHIPQNLNYIGVMGVKEDDSDFGAGVLGWNRNTNAGGTHYGIYGIANGNVTGTQQITDKNIAVYGSASGNYKNIGIYGYAPGTNDYAGYFTGRIYASDKVGIGTESPTSTLSVNAASGASPFKLSVNNSSKLIVNSYGNMGIGTTVPGCRLHLKGSGEMLRLDAASPYLTFHNNSMEKAYIQCDNGNMNLGTTGANATGNLYFYLNSGPKMTILNNGNVGIGTTNPGAKLSINGGGAAIDLIGTDNYIQFYNSSNVAKSFIQNSGNDLLLGLSNGNTTGKVSLLSAGGNLSMNKDGNVMINTNTPATGYKLSVNGKIICEELKVQLHANWPDYVFSDNYNLKSIEEVNEFIKANKHLPNIPPAVEIEKSGLSVGEMQSRMMEKIEELTLYVIQLKTQHDELQTRLKTATAK